MKILILIIFICLLPINNVYPINTIKIHKDFTTVEETIKFHNELNNFYVDDITEIKKIIYLDILFCRNIPAYIRKENESNIEYIEVKSNNDDFDYYVFRLHNFYIANWFSTLQNERCNGIGQHGGVQLKGYYFVLHDLIEKQGVSVINLYGIRPEFFIK